MSRNAKKERNIPYLEELQQALSHQAAGHLGQAEEILQRVLAHKPNHAMALRLLGRLYCDSGRVEQGVDCLERCVQCEPGEVSNYTELGHVLRVTGRRDEAEQVLLKGIGLKSNDPHGHYELGCLYHDQTKLELASAELNLALKLNPDHIAARQRLGEVHQALGQSGEAEACFRRVITKSPHDPEAHRGLAYLKRFDEYSSDIESMEASYEKSSAQGMDRIVLAFSLGKVFEDLERYDESFTYYEEANRLHRSLYQFSIDQEAAYFETYREAFTPDWLKDTAKHAIEDETPIFVIGMPRSGTSLVEQILASHSSVFGAGEVYHSSVFDSQVAQTTGRPFPQSISSVPAEVLIQSAQVYVENLRTDADQSARITDKLPHNFLRVGLLAAVMPQARIIHCVRDPMDTCLSIFTHFFSSAHGYASDLRELGQYYRLYERLMQDWEARFPGCMHRISYEDLVADHEREINRLLEYCGLPFEPGCLRFHETIRAVNTPSAVQVRQPLYQSAVSRWKRYETHLRPLHTVLAERD
ncbi:MAG: sulfotransferase [Gammaproteobacteria bacterium]|nr:sulfotransferase [Gammaproteobacteria bacterium]